jgi:hypothetical protein
MACGAGDPSLAFIGCRLVGVDAASRLVTETGVAL